jgi:tripartite-type tricarboxylate transporter receptor subunit TctC
MTINRHRMLWAAAVGTLTSFVAPAIGIAQSYPSRPIRIIVPFPPGSTPETVARMVGSKLTEQLGQQVIVDQRPGGSGVIAVELAKSASPDGHTLLLAGTTAFATLPALKRNLSYDPQKDFIALSRVASVANVMAVHTSLGVNTVADLVKLAKARPGQLNYGSSGNGTAPHLAGELFNTLAGVQTVHIPYKGTPLALNDLIAGRLQFIMTSPIVVMSHATTGKIKIIATLGAKRDPLLPELPTVADTIPGFESTLWWGVAVPVKTPAAIVTRLNAELVKAMETPGMREALAKQSTTAHAESPSEFTAFIKAERERIARVGRQIGLVLD